MKKWTCNKCGTIYTVDPCETDEKGMVTHVDPCPKCECQLYWPTEEDEEEKGQKLPRLICPIMSNHQRNLGRRNCVEARCALWVPEQQCCCHRADTKSLEAMVADLQGRLLAWQVTKGDKLLEVVVTHTMSQDKDQEPGLLIRGKGLQAYRGDKLLVIKMKP
jgi:hypothetical protein